MDGDVGVGIKLVKIIERTPRTKMIRTRDGRMRRLLSIAIVLSLLLVVAA